MILQYISMLALVLLIPTLVLYLCKKYNGPTILYLLLAALVSNRVVSLIGIEIPQLLGKVLITVAIAILLFEIYSRVKIKEHDFFYSHVLRAHLILLVICSFVIAFVIHKLFAFQNFFYSLIPAVLFAGTSYILFETQERKWFVTKLNSFLETEAILSTALSLAVALIFSAFAVSITIGKNNAVLYVPFMVYFVKVIVGIGTGIVIGLIVSKYFSNLLKSRYLFLFLLAVIICTYLFAEALQGSGILATIVMSLFFGNIYLKHKEEHQKFSSIYNNLLYIFIFLFISFYTTMPFELIFYGKALIVFLAYLLVRFIVLALFLPADYTMKNKIVLTFIMPKEMEILIVGFFLLLTQASAAFLAINSLIVTVTLYSIVVSLIAMRFSKFHAKA